MREKERGEEQKCGGALPIRLHFVSSTISLYCKRQHELLHLGLH